MFVEPPPCADPLCSRVCCFPSLGGERVSPAPSSPPHPPSPHPRSPRPCCFSLAAYLAADSWRVLARGPRCSRGRCATDVTGMRACGASHCGTPPSLQMPGAVYEGGRPSMVALSRSTARSREVARDRAGGGTGGRHVADRCERARTRWGEMAISSNQRTRWGEMAISSNQRTRWG